VPVTATVKGEYRRRTADMRSHMAFHGSSTSSVGSSGCGSSDTVMSAPAATAASIVISSKFRPCVARFASTATQPGARSSGRRTMLCTASSTAAPRVRLSAAVTSTPSCSAIWAGVICGR
jgi:hypothetical protein